MKQAATLLVPLLIILPTISIPLAANETATLKAEVKTLENKGPFTGHIPAESLYQLLTAEMALDREHPEVALANYIAAAQETQDASIAARATQIALSLSSLEIAIEPAMIWAKADPKNLEAQITTAALFIRLDQVPKAIPYLVQSEKLNAEEAFQYYLLLYKQLQKEEDTLRVIQALQAVAKQEVKENSAHLALAEIYLFQNKDQSALEMSEGALKIDPNSLSGIQLYTEALLRTKGKEPAKAFLSKRIEANPGNVLLGQFYAQFLVENGFNEASRDEIERLMKNPHIKTEELLQFARISMQAQWFDLAEKILLKTKADPESKDLSHYFLARLNEMQNNEEAAIEWFKQVLTGPFHVLSQLRASLLLADKGRYEQALEILSRTQPNDDTDKKQIVLTTAEVLNKANHYQDSLQILTETLKTMPDDLDLLYARSMVSEHLGKLDIAEKDLKAILAQEPNNLEALNALGFMLADKTQRFKEAQQYLDLAMKISPNNASILDSYGWLHYKMGDEKKSLEYLQKAAKIMPNPEIAAHLGEVMWKMKDYEGAKRVWSEALNQNPKHQIILNVMQRLTGKTPGFFK